IGLKHEFWDYVLEHDTFLTAEQALKIGFIHAIVKEKKPAPYEADSVRSSFNAEREAQVPNSAAEIVKVLNTVSANGAKYARVRGELITALAQYPEFWTEGKKAEMAGNVTKPAANDAKNNVVPKPKTAFVGV